MCGGGGGGVSVSVCVCVCVCVSHYRSNRPAAWDRMMRQFNSKHFPQFFCTHYTLQEQPADTQGHGDTVSKEDFALANTTTTLENILK